MEIMTQGTVVWPPLQSKIFDVDGKSVFVECQSIDPDQDRDGSKRLGEARRLVKEHGISTHQAYELVNPPHRKK